MDFDNWIDVLEDRDLYTEELRELLIEAIQIIKNDSSEIVVLREKIEVLKASIEALEAIAIILAEEIS